MVWCAHGGSAGTLLIVHPSLYVNVDYPRCSTYENTLSPALHVTYDFEFMLQMIFEFMLQMISEFMLQMIFEFMLQMIS